MDFLCCFSDDKYLGSDHVCKHKFKKPSNLHAKMAILNLQRYTWTLNLIKNVVFLTWKSVLFLRVSPISIASYIQEMRKSLLQRTRKETNKNWYLIHAWSDKAFKGNVVNRHSHVCMEGHLKLRLQSLSNCQNCAHLF